MRAAEMEKLPETNGKPGRTKGMGWAVMIRSYEATHGRPKLLSALAAMPERWRRGLDERHETLGILDGSWYPEEQRNAFFDGITTGMTLLQQQALARVFAQAVMAHSLRGLHRMIFSIMATPERFVKHAQSLWDVHHDTGKLRMKLLSPTSVEATVAEWPAHRPFPCMINHYACLVTLEARGCSDTTDRRVCISDGAPDCTGVYYWRK
jgi:hypothetical protein